MQATFSTIGFKETENKIIIGKKSGDPISKTQKEFNRLSKKIEKLTKDIQFTRDEMDRCLTYYGTEIAPLEKEMTALQLKLVKLLHPHCSNRRISPGDKEMLKNFMGDLLFDISSIGKITPDEELKKIIETVDGKEYEMMRNEEFSALKQEMEREFKDMGMDIDLSSFNPDDSEEETIRKFAQMGVKMKKKLEEDAKKKGTIPKNKRQLKQEEKERQLEEARSRNISAIYKQLAKVMHPDLELDPQLKSEKETLMKELTQAYQKNDLHTLLRLEMNWLNKESSHLETLPEEKMKIYIQLLKEQVKEMEFTLDMTYSHPRYLPLERFSDAYTGRIYLNDLSNAKIRVKKIINGVTHHIHNMETDYHHGIKFVISCEREKIEMEKFQFNPEMMEFLRKL